MGRNINKLRNKKGFTLIELIVVLAVLAIIMAIAVPRFTGVQEEAKKETDRATLANIVKISEFYLVKGEMEKGTETADKVYSDSTEPKLRTIIDDDFPNDVDFQSEGNVGSGLDAVTVSIDDEGAVYASIGSEETGTLVKYPK